MEQILLAYGLPNEILAAITILYRNTKVKVRSPDGDTEYFDIVAGVLQGDTLAPYLLIICLDYVLRTSIDKIWENGFELTKKWSRRYPAKTEYMRYNQTGDISTQDWTPLKLVDTFTYLGNSVSSTEKDIDTRLTKAWTAINRLSISHIYKNSSICNNSV